MAKAKSARSAVEPNWANRTIFEGDNLDVLRGMNSASVDLVYLDPPFNSNRNYSAPIGSVAAGAAFKDTWTLSDLDVAWLGLIADQEPALYQAIAAAELTHGKGMKSYLIMMAVRLLELKRILKPTGSIYLHVDPTASHYLKLVMDSVFGVGDFRNEIVWCSSTGVRNDVKTKFGHGHDVILYYAGRGAVFNMPYMALSDDYVAISYRYREADGRRYIADNLKAPGGRGYAYSFLGVDGVWRMNEERAHELLKAGRIIHESITPGSRSKVPRYKRYADESKGRPCLDNWMDIKPLTAQAKERCGYPTQKPLELLDRIIKASSNEGDMVLDPFCGCATTCVSAEMSGRQWIGIDLSPLASTLVKQRLQQASDENALFKGGRLPKVYDRTDIPQRTDRGVLPNYRTHKHVLYGEQEGNCKGCGVHFPFRNMTVDHILPRSKGGTDHLDNLQLLCGACNSMKGSRTQALNRVLNRVFGETGKR